MLGAVLPARLALVLADQVLGFALWGGSWLARLPGTHWVIGRQSGWLLPLYFLLLAALLGRGWFSRQSGRMVRGTVLATLCSLCLLLAAFQRVKQPLTAYFLDVGQGDCAVVVTPEKEVLVVDMGGLSGHFDTGERILVPFLRYLGADKVTLALVSHGHHDHAGGLTSLLTWFPVETLCLPDDLAAPDVEKALHVGKNTGSVKSIYKVQQAQRFMLKKGALQIVEAPKIGEKAGASNETSVVVRLLHPSGRILFTGDAPGELERSAARNSIQSDVLKISHHGSKTSSDSEFLKTVRPQLAVISAGRKNKFGHPHEETLKKLKNLHIPVVRTDKQGAIKITFDEHGVWWYSYVNMNNNTVWK